MPKTPFFLLLTGLFLSTTARAASIEDAVGGVDEVLINDIVEVKLYTDISGEPVPHLMATINDDPDHQWLFAVSTRQSVTIVSDALVDEYELTVKTTNKKLINLKGEDAKWKVGGEIKYVEIDSLRIGELELKGVTALVSSSKARIGTGSADLQLGMGAYPELAYAILPGEGVFRFAPADRGSELIEALQGTRGSYTASTWDTIKFGKDKKIHPARTLITDVSVGGASARGALDPSEPSSTFSPDLEITSSAERVAGDTHSFWSRAAVGGTALGEDWVTRDGGLERGAYTHDAVIGANLLAEFNLVVSPASSAFAIARSTEQTRHDPRPAALASAVQDATEAEAEASEGSAEDSSAEDSSAEDSSAALAGPWKAVAELQTDMGDYESALKTWEKIIGYDAEDCSSWLHYGQLQMRANQTAAAIKSLQQASTLYHSWWDLELAERTELEESEDADKPRSQAGACYVADDHLAAAYLTRGGLDQVAALYRDRLDLSAGLAQVQGNAALLTGDLSAAHSAYRRALSLEGRPDQLPRLGLALAYQSEGDWESAETLYRAALKLSPDSIMGAQLWVDAITRNQSAAAAQRSAQAFLKANPDSHAAFIALARTSRMAGDAGELAKITRQGDAHFKKAAARSAFSGEVLAANALFLVETGRLDAGRAMAEQALLIAPDSPSAWLALGNVYVLQGDIARGETLLKRSGQHGVTEPGYALLLDAEPPRPVQRERPEAPE